MLNRIELKPIVLTNSATTRLVWFKRLMLSKALLVIIPFYILQLVFNYPHILYKRADIVQALYNQNSGLVNLAFVGLALSGLCLSGLSWQLPVLIKDSSRLPVRVMVGLGTLVGLLQFVSFASWLFFSNFDFGAFQFFWWLVSGVLMNFLLVFWTITLALFLRKQGQIGRWQTGIGLLIALGLEISIVRPLAALFGLMLRPIETTDFDWAGLFNLTGSISEALWLVWLIWVAFSFKEVWS